MGPPPERPHSVPPQSGGLQMHADGRISTPCSQFTKAVRGCVQITSESQPCWPPQMDELSTGQTRRSTQTWQESSEFNGWLEQRLTTDRRELVARMQESLDRHLAGHQQAVLGELRAGMDISFAAASGSGTAGDAAPRPLSGQPISAGSADLDSRLKDAVPTAASSSGPTLPGLPGPSPRGPAPETPDRRAESAQRSRKDREKPVRSKKGDEDDESTEVDRDAREEKLNEDCMSLQGGFSPRRAGECGPACLGNMTSCMCVPGYGSAGGSGRSGTSVAFAERDSSSRGNSDDREGSDGTVGRKKRSRSNLSALHRRKQEGMHDQLGFKRFISLQGLVSSSQFELVCSFLIVLNVVVMAIEVQVAGCEVGFTIGHPDCPLSTKHVWIDASRGFLVASAIFNVLFFVELALRVAALGRAAFRSAWIWFDASLIAVGSLDLAQRMGGSLAINVNPTIMRTARIARILRMIRFLKPHEGFSSLFLITRSIHASRHALGWSILILMIMVSVVGMMVTQMVFLSLEDGSLGEADRRELFDYWGTYSRMVVTMFEITLGNWAPPCRMLMTKLTQWWGLFIVAYRCMFCYSIVSVIGAVFITETSRAAATDDEVAMIRKEREHKGRLRKLMEVFVELDESGDGIVTWEEFQEALNDPHMKRYLATMELEVNDMEGLFRLLDDGDGAVHADEFVNGISTLRGQAKNIDLLMLLKVTRRMNNNVERLGDGLLTNDFEKHRGSHRRSSIASQS